MKEIKKVTILGAAKENAPEYRPHCGDEARIAIWAKVKAMAGLQVKENEAEYLDKKLVLEISEGGPMDVFIQNCSQIIKSEDKKKALERAMKFGEYKRSLHNNWVRLAKGRLYLPFGENPIAIKSHGIEFSIHPWDDPEAIRGYVLDQLMDGKDIAPKGAEASNVGGFDKKYWRDGRVLFVQYKKDGKITSYELICGRDRLRIFPNGTDKETKLVRSTEKSRYVRDWVLFVNPKNKRVVVPQAA